MENTHPSERTPQTGTGLEFYQKSEESFKTLYDHLGKKDEEELEEEEEEYDRYKDNPDLLNETRLPGGSRLFSYDWYLTTSVHLISQVVAT